MNRGLTAKMVVYCLYASCLIVGCGGGTSVTQTTQIPKISITPSISAVPVDTNVTFTAHVSGDPTASTPGWSLTTVGSPSPDAGTLSSNSGGSITYTAPHSPPIYMGFPPAIQGTVTLQAGTSGAFGDGLADTTFSITASQVTTGILPTAVAVALRDTQFFTAYAVGNLNNGVTFQVNGVAGGSGILGTIANTGNSAGLYTAPAALPMSGNTVTITAISQADPTKSSSATITLH